MPTRREFLTGLALAPFAVHLTAAQGAAERRARRRRGDAGGSAGPGWKAASQPGGDLPCAHLVD